MSNYEKWDVGQCVGGGDGEGVVGRALDVDMMENRLAGVRSMSAIAEQYRRSGADTVHEWLLGDTDVSEPESDAPTMSIKDWISCLFDEFSLADQIYKVRDRVWDDDPEYEGNAWDHPSVTRFQAMFTALDEYRK